MSMLRQGAGGHSDPPPVVQGGGGVGKDIHEKRKWNDESDRNPNSPGAGPDGSLAGRPVPPWVRKKIEASRSRKAAEAPSGYLH